MNRNHFDFIFVCFKIVKRNPVSVRKRNEEAKKRKRLASKFLPLHRATCTRFGYAYMHVQSTPYHHQICLNIYMLLLLWLLLHYKKSKTKKKRRIMWKPHVSVLKVIQFRAPFRGVDRTAKSVTKYNCSIQYR